MYSFILEFLSVTNLVLLGLFTVLYFVWKQHRRRPDLPPGPRGLPFIGVVDFNTKNRHERRMKLREKYGDIYGFYTGDIYIVVVNGYETLREVFVKHGDEFSERPTGSVFKIANNQGIFGSSGKLWKEHRTFALSTLREFGFGKRNIETRIMEEVSCFMESVEKTNSKAFDVKERLHISVSNVICSIVFGKRFDYDDPKFVKMIHLLNSNLSNLRALFALQFPILQKIPGDILGFQKFLQRVQETDDCFKEFIDEHKLNWNENKKDDYIDAYLTEMDRRKGDVDNTFDEKQLIKVVADLFAAGTDTTATTIRWAILYCLNFPEMQTAIRTELNNVVGTSRFPSLCDRPNLPYTNAFITEVLRLGRPTEGVPHSVKEDTMIKGYRIPKNSFVIPYIDSVNLDENLFPNPTKFDPRRFLDKNGEKFQEQEKIISFSLGRRVCMGESLARNEIFLFLTSLIQRCELLPEDTIPPPIEGVMGLTYSPKDYKFRAKSIE